MNSVWPGKTGYEKRKKVYSDKNVKYTFFDDAHQPFFSVFSLKVPHYNMKINPEYVLSVSLSLSPLFHNFHHSIIPVFF
jgi:hypothetical protein